MKLLSRLGGFHRLAIPVLVLLACFAFLAPRADAQGLLPLQPVKVVQVPDHHLQTAINKATGKSLTGPITTTQLAGLTSLDASGSAQARIANLSGLEHATNLIGLDLSGNAISNLGPLQNLTTLRLLNLSSNIITDISPLKKLTELVRLDVSHNNITGLTGIEDMTKLTYLYLDAGEISDVSALRTLLEKPNVNLSTNILLVKEVRFVNPPTVYRAGNSVEIDVEFYNSQVRYSSTAQQQVDYTGDVPYLALQFGGDTANQIFRAEWVEDTSDDPGNTVVSFSYLVPSRASADSITISKLKVPDDTRLTYVYSTMSSFPLGLASHVVFNTNTGFLASIALPSSLPVGNRIDASGPVFPRRTQSVTIPETTAADVGFYTFDATDPTPGATITYSIPDESLQPGIDLLNFKIVGNELQLKQMLDFDNAADELVIGLDENGNELWRNAAGDNEYVFVVQASSGTPPETDLQRITVTVTDVLPPLNPVLTVTGPTANPEQLNLSWTQPTDAATRATVTGYDIRYQPPGVRDQQNNIDKWLIDVDHTGTGTTATITGLDAGTSYNVWVRATTVADSSDWVQATQSTAANSPPIFPDDDDRDLKAVGEDNFEIAAFNITDDDDDDSVGTPVVGGTDGEFFTVWFDDPEFILGLTVNALDFERPVDKPGERSDPPDPADPGAPRNNIYVFTMTVTSGTANRAITKTATWTVEIVDVIENPPQPRDLGTSGPSDTPDELDVEWWAGGSPPDKNPPPVLRYVVQYRKAGTNQWSSKVVAHTGEQTDKQTTTITGLEQGVTYNVWVRAINDEGQSDWRQKNDAKTADNAAPRFTTSQTTFSVTENTPITTPVTTIAATDADAIAATDEDKRDTVITYTLGDTADHAAFEIGADTGVLRFKNVPDFENPADTAVEEMEDPSRNSPAGDNVYIVAVTATSGEGARALDETLWLTITVTDVIEYDNTPPVVQQLAFASPPSGGYTLGSEILVEVTFDDDGVDIPAGVAQDERPFVTLYLGEATAANRRRAYWQGRRDGNSTIVTFAYEVQADDFATTITIDEELGITVPPDVPIRNSAGVAAETTSVRGGGTAARGQEQVRIEFPDVPPQRGGGTQPGAAPQTAPSLTLTQEVFVSGTPVFIPETVDGRYAASEVPRTPLVFNELGNGTGADNDWLELRNVTGSAVSLKDWELSVVQDGEKKDTSLIVFGDVSVPANGVLLVTNQPSDKTPLAGGVNKGLSHASLVDAGLSLPDDGQFLLILRNVKEKLGKNEAFVDVAGGGGSDTDAFIREQAGLYDTHVWPLQVLQAPGGDTEEALGSGKVWQRAKADSVGYHKDAWAEAAFTGLGYDRQVTQSAATGGTPGYPNGAAKATVATPKGSVTISELMFASGGGTLPQWIELYNRSKTEVLNLNRWKLELQNINSAALVGRPVVTLTLGEQLLQPNQTVLIVAGDARASSRSHLPADRIYNLFALHQKNLRVKTPRDTFLSADGFTLKLTDRDGTLVDEVGNTDGNRRTNDAPAWALPVSPEAGVRSSLVRRYDKGIARNGKERASWVLASNIGAIDGALYYGHATDLGTPGWREGGALPVELSGFSVSRTESGAVVLTWQTESEVENAGFNLRRSERRAGDFTLINAALIAGAGTTGERQTYTFTDTSATPGVEYYYQLEEVSFAGKPQTLAMRLLRGPVSAANRQLRTFGEVKKAK